MLVMVSKNMPNYELSFCLSQKCVLENNKNVGYKIIYIYVTRRIGVFSSCIHTNRPVYWSEADYERQIKLIRLRLFHDILLMAENVPQTIFTLKES